MREVPLGEKQRRGGRAIKLTASLLSPLSSSHLFSYLPPKCLRYCQQAKLIFQRPAGVASSFLDFDGEFHSPALNVRLCGGGVVPYSTQYVIWRRDFPLPLEEKKEVERVRASSSSQSVIYCTKGHAQKIQIKKRSQPSAAAVNRGFAVWLAHTR